ncbi:9885_t:CDS:2 [Paraglomus brasilianum]|uniref:9885_t:CDS:1 n=1 Tax=Paraglomus brasilianum TaxID=144538 RepID=A0A9N8W886_9GLOM|nr:9885_t:CDS:2 [Paraglomus brasilianum]
MPLSDTSALTTPSTSEIDTPSSIMAFSTEEFSLLLALGNCYDGNQNEVDFDRKKHKTPKTHQSNPTFYIDHSQLCKQRLLPSFMILPPHVSKAFSPTDVAPDITNFDVYMNNDLQFAIVNESPSSNNSSNPTAANTSYDLLTTFQGPFTTTEGSFNTFSTDCRAGINNYSTTFNENCDAGFVAGVKNYNRRGSKDIDIIINDMDDSDTNYGTDDSNNNVCQARCNGNRKHNDRVEEPNDRNEQIRTQKTLTAEAPSPSRISRKRKAAEELEITQDEKRAKFLERNRQAALKCRQKKKEFTTNLKKHVEDLEAEKTILTNSVNHLREQVLYLKSLMICHGGCDCGIIPEYLQTYGIQMPATIIQSQQQPPQPSQSRPPHQQPAQQQHSQYPASTSNFLA